MRRRPNRHQRRKAMRATGPRRRRGSSRFGGWVVAAVLVLAAVAIFAARAT